MSADDFLKLLEKTNVKLGEVDPQTIRGWFDTDCADLLQWISTSITEDCYVPPQIQLEYEQLEPLTNEQLDKKLKLIESQYPDIFETESNLLDIEIGKDTIEILEEQLKNYDHQIHVNERLLASLEAEHSKLAAEEIQTKSAEESTQEECIQMSKKLDQINEEIFAQLMKYAFHLSHYEHIKYAGFINNIDISHLEEKFSQTVNVFNSVIEAEDIFAVKSIQSYADTLSELEQRIFQSKMKNLFIKMDLHALKSVSNFLNEFDMESFLKKNSVAVSVEHKKEEQSLMISALEEKIGKLTKQHVNQAMLQPLRSEFEFYESKLHSIVKFKDWLLKTLIHFVIMEGLYSQEKLDIDHSKQLFSNVHKYVNNELKENRFRQKAMLEVMSHYESFCLMPVQHKFKLVGDFGTILLKNNKATLEEICEEAALIRGDEKKLKKQQWLTPTNNLNVAEKLRSNIQILRNFLVSGPSVKIVIAPVTLELLLLQVNKTLVNMNLSTKSLIPVTKAFKDRYSKDKWLQNKNKLLVYFLTNPAKMLTFIEQIKSV